MRGRGAGRYSGTSTGRLLLSAPATRAFGSESGERKAWSFERPLLQAEPGRHDTIERTGEDYTIKFVDHGRMASCVAVKKGNVEVWHLCDEPFGTDCSSTRLLFIETQSAPQNIHNCTSCMLEAVF